MLSEGRIRAIGDLILGHVVTRMATGDFPAPERRYVGFGIPPVDCEQLVLQFRFMLPTTGNVTQQGNQWNTPQLPQLTLPAISWALWCHRCVSMALDDGAGNVSLPSLADLEADGLKLTADAANMWAGVLNAEGDDYTTKPIPQRGLGITQLEALENSGGFGGSVLYFDALTIERQ